MQPGERSEPILADGDFEPIAFDIDAVNARLLKPRHLTSRAARADACDGIGRLDFLAARYDVGADSGIPRIPRETR